MSELQELLSKLKKVKSELQQCVNHTRSFNKLLSQAYQAGHLTGDFLPRRLNVLKTQEQLKFQTLINHLNRLVNLPNEGPFMVFSSTAEISTALSIRKTVRYIQNAFAADLPVGPTIEKINRALS